MKKLFIAALAGIMLSVVATSANQNHTPTKHAAVVNQFNAGFLDVQPADPTWMNWSGTGWYDGTYVVIGGELYVYLAGPYPTSCDQRGNNCEFGN